jgi:flavin-dependent dehydrogenase
MTGQNHPAKHIVVVGAGPGGLTTAMLLANRGFKVTVFEKEPHVGGRNAAIVSNGYKFDTRPNVPDDEVHPRRGVRGGWPEHRRLPEVRET